jgi:hypothetical protein
MSKSLPRAHYMSSKQKADMPAGVARTHEACIRLTGVARPGKTAADRAKRFSVAS